MVSSLPLACNAASCSAPHCFGWVNCTSMVKALAAPARNDYLKVQCNFGIAPSATSGLLADVLTDSSAPMRRERVLESVLASLRLPSPEFAIMGDRILLSR